MPNIKIPHGPYLNEDALEREINGYVYPKSFIRGGLAVDPNYAVEQMRMMKEVWNQTGGKQLHHFILNFSPWESAKITNMGALKQLGYKVCEFFAEQHQIVFGVHDNGHLHIHFVLNSVNYRTGQKFVHRNGDDLFLADLIKNSYIPSTLGYPFPIRKIEILYH